MYLIDGKPLQAPDVDGLVNDRPAAFSFAGMFADQRTGGRKRIPVANQIDGAGIIAFPDQGNITRDIYVCRAERTAGNRLSGIFHTASVPDMTFIFILELLQAVQDQMGRGYADCAVGCPGDHLTQIVQLFGRIFRGISVQNALQQSVSLHQSVPAGYAFSAGLAHGDLKQGTIKHKRAHTRRIGIHSGPEFLQHNVNPVIHAGFCG